ncbi:RNA N6-adenosine-methyltransferase mettl16 isoform X2 [Oryza brachyantha]|uniref:RNA N6-adenosine-methyltransferase mettl16 isoform X2 n=1 Tax=Oryza brachyantha TaxID=4533 RepID=UPI001ADA09C3|nr:RNA N6-adenosine-methyltransferase mettl16 isoform X2 [Oryza brachyantha]
MGGGRKRRRRDGSEAPAIHPRNRYAAAAPDFAALASLYPSFAPFVSVSRGGRASIDFTDFAATRELTRVLLLHDHGVNWWIPDGQLCPTVPNRSNYIHWIEDLLSSDLIPPLSSSNKTVRGFDIGTDVTDVALEWARKNVENNPQLVDLIEIRNANKMSCSSESEAVVGEADRENTLEPVDGVGWSKLCILLGVVKDCESFDFCMCNPPFFESIQEAGLNPRTSCGGTAEEMVCPGGEQAFISRIIEDSVSLKNSFRWFTSMVGRKANLKLLVSKIREAGASVVKTTEFVQGQTARWGLAWSFIAPRKMVVRSSAPGRANHSFMLHGLRREYGAFQVLKSAETFFHASNLSCKIDSSLFSIDVTLSDDLAQAAMLLDESDSVEGVSTKLHSAVTGTSFRISVFEQMPGTLLVKGSLLNKALSGIFSSTFSQLEDTLKMEFLSKAR